MYLSGLERWGRGELIPSFYVSTKALLHADVIALYVPVDHASMGYEAYW
jgi:hypothetical protein